MSEPTPSQAEGERDDQEGIDQTRGLSARRSGRESEKHDGGEAAPTPSQAEGGRTSEEGAEQDRGGKR